MNRNVFEALNAVPDGGAPKNPFDLHNFEWMTSKAGQLLPVGCREVVPDGTYDLSVDAYTMTFPCNTASQADMKENYYFLFVPYYLLTRTAYAFFPQRKDNHSALDYQFEQMPWFPLGDVVSYCVKSVGDDMILGNGGHHALAPEIDDVHGLSNAAGALRLLDLLGYGCYLDCVQKYVALKDSEVSGAGAAFIAKLKDSLNAYKPNALRIAAYQKVWYCYFRNSVYDNEITPKSFNFDDVTYPSDTTYNILDYRTVEEFVNTCLQMRYVENKKDVISASMPGTQFGAVSSVPLSVDLGDLGASFVGDAVTPTFTGNVTQASATTSNDANRHVNKWLNNGQVLTDVEMSEYFKAGGQTTQIPYFKPYSINSASGNTLTIGVSPRASVSGVQMNFVTEPGQALINDEHTHSVSVPIAPSGTISTITPSGTITVTGSGGTTATLFDVLQLTEAQAIQKWRQKSMLAGQKSKDQWRAHYGVVPEHMQDDYPDFIGSVDNLIHISQVVSSANTLADDDKSNLGDIAGRGYGASDNKKFRFHAKEYGVVMLLRSVVAENVYASYGIDRANQLIYYSDFWQPEFQNIGLEAVPKSIIQGFKPASEVDPTGEGGSSPLPANSSVIGYAPRNYQLKQYRSRVHGLFNPNRFLDQIPSILHPDVPFGFGELEAFVQLRRDVVQELVYSDTENTLTIGNVPITLSTLYVNPQVTNSTFAFDADAFEDTDTFITKHRFNCDSVQPLTTLGLPQF